MIASSASARTAAVEPNSCRHPWSFWPAICCPPQLKAPFHGFCFSLSARGLDVPQARRRGCYVHSETTAGTIVAASLLQIGCSTSSRDPDESYPCLCRYGTVPDCFTHVWEEQAFHRQVGADRRAPIVYGLVLCCGSHLKVYVYSQ